jgi:FtsH-binding integral membrane protein
MEETTQQLRKLNNSMANTYGALSLGLFSGALWTCSTRNHFGTIIFLVFGIVSILTSFYLAFLPKWHRKKNYRLGLWARN